MLAMVGKVFNRSLDKKFLPPRNLHFLGGGRFARWLFWISSEPNS